jgi:hypothetical protein
MKLLFFIPVWKRPEITEICFMGIYRLRRLGIHDISALAIISEEEMKPLCEKYGIEWCFYKNSPLGEKKNFGVQEAMKRDFDYLIEMGSDDLLKNEFLNLYTWDYPVMGLNDFIIINSEDGRCRRISGKALCFGPGRAISREALQSGNLWSDKQNRSLDKVSTFTLARRGFTEKRFKSDEPLCIDIKSAVNIWGYSPIGSKYPFELALEGLSEQEIEAIKSLEHVAA